MKDDDKSRATSHELIDADLALLQRPLIDVRAPIEFAAGALPGAINLPLMDDDERREVGIRYKHAGQASAVELGNRLVSGESREARLVAWEQAIKAAPDSVIYCFRGGMRSKISQQWLAERGYPLPRIRGGWKAMRTRFIETLEARTGMKRPDNAESLSLHAMHLHFTTGGGKSYSNSVD